MNGIGKMLLVAGGGIALAGVAVILFSQTGLIGKLPGDILIKKENFTFYFPVVTFLILSVVLTILINLIIRLFK